MKTSIPEMIKVETIIQYIYTYNNTNANITANQ